MPRNVKNYNFDFSEVSSAIDRISVQGSTVLINFAGNARTYEYEWKPANAKLVSKLQDLEKNPESFSLGKFYNESLKNGDLIQKPQN